MALRSGRDREIPGDSRGPAARQEPGVGVGKRTRVQELEQQLAQRRAREPGFGPTVENVQAAAAHGTSGSAGALPHLDTIQRLFGRHDVSRVQAHTDGAAREGAIAMGAQAYAFGDRVAFAGAPDLHTAAHEAAHVVQQRGEVQLKGGIDGGAGDPLERHADQVADAVVAGRSAVPLLDAYAGSGSAPVVQRDSRSVPPAIDSGGPKIRHDHGHLDDGNGNLDESRREEPTLGDHLDRMKWIAKMEAAEILRPDLVDGIAAYRHFLFGNGQRRDVHYWRFLTNDSSGQKVLASALEDTRHRALARHDQDVACTVLAEGTQSYQILTGIIGVKGGGRYPYPATENWQKALGGHSIWIEASVTATVTRVAMDPGTASFKRSFAITMTIHTEDMYNFNPGASDIATRTPDSENGRFEITGLGQEYINYGTFKQSFSFESSMAPVGSPEHHAGANDVGRPSFNASPPGPHGQPSR
jgi:hypothetical protein